MRELLLRLLPRRWRPLRLQPLRRGPWDGTYQCRDIRPSDSIKRDSSAPVGYCQGWVGTITITDGFLRGSLKQIYKPNGEKNFQSRIAQGNIVGRVPSSGAFDGAILRVSGRFSYKFNGALAGAGATQA